MKTVFISTDKEIRFAVRNGVRYVNLSWLFSIDCINCIYKIFHLFRRKP
jgi:hypothetical protein